MGGKGGAGPPGGDAITWGPLARENGWGWDPSTPAAAATEAAPEAAPMAMTAPEPEVAATPAAAAAAPQAQGPIGDPISPGQATDGKITTTPDTGSKLAQTVMAPAMWTDQLKTPGLNGSGSMQTTGQV